jgi:hypothetical protein
MVVCARLKRPRPGTLSGSSRLARSFSFSDVMWAWLASLGLFLAAGAACAQSPEDNMQGRDLCFRAALAEVICSRLPGARQGDCLKGVQALQLQCKQHLSGMPPNTAPSTDETTAAVRPDTSAKENGKPSREENWIVSETKSPVDYSPLMIATIRSKSDAGDGQNILSVRCSTHHIEVMVGMNGEWNRRRGKALKADYQINDQPMVHEQWRVSADGTGAILRHPVGFLRSIPDGATLKVGVAQKRSARRDALFQLNGLDAVRQKVGILCTPVTARTSPENHRKGHRGTQASNPVAN